MKKAMLVLIVVAGSTLVAFTTKASVRENPCGHPCAVDRHNACCTGITLKDNGDIIAWTKNRNQSLADTAL